MSPVSSHRPITKKTSLLHLLPWVLLPPRTAPSTNTASSLCLQVLGQHRRLQGQRQDGPTPSALPSNAKGGQFLKLMRRGREHTEESPRFHGVLVVPAAAWLHTARRWRTELQVAQFLCHLLRVSRMALGSSQEERPRLEKAGPARPRRYALLLDKCL